MNSKMRDFYATHLQHNLFSIASVITVILFPILYIYLLNIERSSFASLAGIICFFLAQGALLCIVALIYNRELNKACLTANFAITILESFALFQMLLNKLSPVFYYWHSLIIFSTVIILFAILIKKVGTGVISKKINFIIFLEMAALCVYNLGNALPDIINKYAAPSENHKQETIIGDPTSTSNVYYIIFDEYGGLECLAEYCNFNNMEFYNQLEALGFNVSTDSMGGSIYSEVEIANRLNLQNMVDPSKPYEEITKSLDKPYLFTFFRENGYQINTMIDQGIPLTNDNSDYHFTYDAMLGESESSTNLIIANSIYYPILERGRGERINRVNRMFAYIEKTPDIQSERLFTFGYFMFPHLPWVVDQNGNKISSANYENWADASVYVGQLKYASKKILEMCEVLIEKDQNAIIILQSDHGYRQPTKMVELYEEDQEIFQYNILNAVYYQGKTLDIRSLSGINTLISVINKEFGTQFKNQDSPKQHEQ